MIVIVCFSIALTQAAAAPLIDDAAKRSSIQMEDVTAASGIDFVTTSGAKPSTQIIEVKGGGIAIIDMDNDGDFDLFFPNGSLLGQPSNGPGARLYENLGGDALSRCHGFKWDRSSRVEFWMRSG